MHYLLRETLLPLKGLSYYGNYFQVLYQIVVCRNLRTIAMVNTCITFCVLKFVHFIFLYFYQLSKTSRMIFFDIFHTFGMSNDNNLIMAGLCLLTALFYWQVYFGNYNRLSSILYEVLIEKNSGFFLSDSFRDQLVSLRIKRVALFAINMFQPMVLITELFALFCQLFTLYNIYLNPNLFLTSLSGLLDLILMQLNCLFMGTFMMMFTHICILLCCLGIIMTFIFFIKMDQIFLVLIEHPPNCTTGRAVASLLSEVARLSRKNFLIFDRMNDVYGKMFSFNLVLNWPINAYLVISMIRIRMTFISYFFIGAFAFQQMACIFGIHWLGTLYSIKIHQSAKPVAAQFVSTRPNFPSLAAKLKVVHYIEDFHNDHRYGGYYWRMGLITMFAFIKYLLLYSEFLMYMYKHFQK